MANSNVQHAVLEAYRRSPDEVARTQDLIKMVPKGMGTALDVGARDGHFSRLLAQHFLSVTALDLVKPQFSCERVALVAGDVTKLPFADGAFDLVFCAEVLEHVSDLDRACAELARVSRRFVIIGVPYRQDTRIGRTVCHLCGRTNPPWGHVNTFDQGKLERLFPACRLIERSFVGRVSEHTNWISVYLMDLAGNPWGVYGQLEPCIHCGKQLERPSSLSFSGRACAALAFRLNRLQSFLAPARPNWIHLLFEKV